MGRRPQGDIRYEDVKERIREQLGQQLAIRRYIDRLRQATYVDVEVVAPPLTMPSSPASRSPSAIHAASAPRSRRAPSAEPLDAEVTVVGAEDQIARLPAAHRVSGGHLGPGQRGAESGTARRAIRAGRIAGHAVETAVQARARRRSGCDRHRAGPQARPPSRRIPLSRTHRMAGPPRGRRGRGDDARLGGAARRAGHHPRAAPGRARRCSRRTGWCAAGRITQRALARVVGNRVAAARGLRGQSRTPGRAGCSATRRQRVLAAGGARHSGPRGRCRPIPSSCGRCEGSSTRCSRPITTWG